MNGWYLPNPIAVRKAINGWNRWHVISHLPPKSF
jgi:hypothetical protein